MFISELRPLLENLPLQTQTRVTVEYSSNKSCVTLFFENPPNEQQAEDVIQQGWHCIDNHTYRIYCWF